MKKSLILLIALILPLNIYSENLSFDEYSQKLEKLSTKANASISVSKDSLIKYCNKILDLENKYDNIKFTRDAIFSIGSLYSKASIMDSALFYLNYALKLNITLQDSTGIGIVKNKLGYVFWLLNKQSEAKKCYEEAIYIHRKFDNNKELGKSLNNLANLYRQWGDYKKSINLFLETLDNYNACNFQEGKAWLDFSLSQLYKRVGNYDQALYHAHSSLKIYEVMAGINNDSTGIRLCYGQLGFLYTHHFDSLNQGLEYQFKALRLAEKSNIKIIIADGLNGVGQTYYKIKEYEKAKEYMQKAYDLRLKSGLKFGLASNLKFLGYIANAQKKYSEAIDYYNRALKSARELNYKNIENDVLLAISKFYMEKKDFEKAFIYLQQHLDLNESILSKEISQKIASTQLQYEIEKKNQENDYLAQQNNIQQIKIKNSKKILNFLIIIIILSTISISIFIFLNYKLRQIKILKGLLPICANCKKIRDDKGDYQQIEHYIAERSEADFSHGICPDCMQELYPEVYQQMKDKKS